MPVPAFDSVGRIPQGRHLCTLDEFEGALVLDPTFSNSVTRRKLFGDLLSAISLFDEFSPDLLESGWFGGGFVSSKLDPSDVDVALIVSGSVHSGLSGRKKDQLAKLARDGFRKLALDVDAFIVPRVRVANPWKGGGISEEVQAYMGLRGAWDDWWLRERNVSTDQVPAIEDADPVRGYLEVKFSG